MGVVVCVLLFAGRVGLFLSWLQRRIIQYRCMILVGIQYACVERGW